MFNWLRNRLLERRRLIFRYWDGKSIHKADPLVVFRALRSHEKFDMETHITAHDNGDDKATAICALATRDAFHVKEYDGKGGLTENECLALLKSFILYVIELKKNISPIATNAPSGDMDHSYSIPPSLAKVVETATQPTADSTSIPDDPNLDLPPAWRTG